MDRAELACVDPERIAEVWPHARHLIKSAIDQTGLSDFAEFEAEVAADKVQTMYEQFLAAIERGGGATSCDGTSRVLDWPVPGW